LPNALIFSPNFNGHRQLHAFVYSCILRKIGYDIFIAGSFTTLDNSHAYTYMLAQDEKIIKINTSHYPEHGMKISNFDFLKLQNEHKIDLTVFVEADNQISLIISQLICKNSRFRGKTVGLFLRPWYFYDKYNFKNSLVYIKGLRHTWKTDSDPRFFHKYLNSTFKLLDVSLYLDEFVVSKQRRSIYIPDIWQQYMNEVLREENPQQRIWIDRLGRFKKINPKSFIILYFGTAQKRRGYDDLLKLAVDNDTCFVHCGLMSYKDNYDLDVDEYRGILEKRGKLFETNEFITDTDCIHYYFKSVTHMVLPYDDSFFGSSGIMLQALGYGIPVLVRDAGLVGGLVKKYKLGLTYGHDTLQKQFLEFKNRPCETFLNSITKYMEQQSLDKFESVLLKAFKN